MLGEEVVVVVVDVVLGTLGPVGVFSLGVVTEPSPECDVLELWFSSLLMLVGLASIASELNVFLFKFVPTNMIFVGILTGNCNDVRDG